MKIYDFFLLNLYSVLRDGSFQGRTWALENEVGDLIALRAYGTDLEDVVVKIKEKRTGPSFGVSPGMTEYIFERI